MDPKQQQPTSQAPSDNPSEPTAPAPEPIAPLPSFNNDTESQPTTQPGQVFTATSTEPAAVTSTPAATAPEATAPDTSSPSATVSIPIFDSTSPVADTVPPENAQPNTPAADATVPNFGGVDTPASPSPAAEAAPDLPSLSDSTPPAEPTSVAAAAPTFNAATPAETPVPPASGNGATVPPSLNAEPSGGDEPNNLRKWIIILVALVFVIGIGTAVAMTVLKKDNSEKNENKTVKVGFLMALTGGSSSMGYGTNKGLQLAKKQLAADNIEIVQADSKCDTKVAPEAVKGLIEQNVVAIIGDGCSSASTAALPAANNAKIPMISPSASSPSLTIPNDYFFRVIPNDNFQGAFMAQAIFDKGLRKVAVFYTNESYGSSMSKVFKEKFESLGGKVLASVSAESDVIDLTAQMNTLKAANPEAIFFSPNSVVSATAGIKVARQVGITVPFFGADAFYDTTIIKEAGAAAVDGLTITSFPTGSKTFKQALLNEYQVTEQLYGAAQAYDAFHAIYQAVKKGATSGEQVAQLLPSIAFEGVSGQISFDENGEISDKNYKYSLLQVKNGEFVTVE